MLKLLSILCLFVGIDQKNSYIDIVDHVIKNSTVTDVAPVVPKRPLRKMFSSSALIGPSQEPGQSDIHLIANQTIEFSLPFCFISD